MKNVIAIAGLATALLGAEANARYFSPRTGNFLSADRAGMIDGPNQYAYVRNLPTMLKDPTGMFAEIDPELPQFSTVYMATNVILADIGTWKITRTPMCSLPSGAPEWREVAERLELAIWSDVSIRGASTWKSRYLQPPRALPAFTEGRTIYLTPAAGHRTIVSEGQTVWEPLSTSTPGGMRQIRSWVGRLGHELTHAAAFYGYGPRISIQQGDANEDLANRVGLFLEDRVGKNFLPIDPTPFNAGPRPEF